MNTRELRDLLANLGRRGVFVVGFPSGLIRTRGPRGELAGAEREALQAHRDEVHALLAAADHAAAEAGRLLAQLRLHAAGDAQVAALDVYAAVIARARQRLDWPLWDAPDAVRALAERWGVCLATGARTPPLTADPGWADRRAGPRDQPHERPTP